MSIIKSAYLELVKVLSPVRHARMIGVSLGDNCLVYRSMEWPSEPYLVTIGNYNSPKGLQYIHMEEEM